VTTGYSLRPKVPAAGTKAANVRLSIRRPHPAFVGCEGRTDDNEFPHSLFKASIVNLWHLKTWRLSLSLLRLLSEDSHRSFISSLSLLFSTTKASSNVLRRKHGRFISWSRPTLPTLQKSASTVDFFLRPVSWVVSGTSRNTVDCVMLSPYEAHASLPFIRQHKVIILHVYSPRVTLYPYSCMWGRHGINIVRLRDIAQIDYQPCALTSLMFSQIKFFWYLCF